MAAAAIVLVSLPTLFGDNDDSLAQGGKAHAITVLDQAGLVSQSAPASTTGNTADVTVGPNGTLTFSPSPVTIAVGDTVRWTWAGFNHTVTSGSPCTVDSSYCSPNDVNCSTAATSGPPATYSHTFNQPGTFPYFCRIHCGFGMTGTVQVLTPFINIVSVNHDHTGFTINGQTTATTVHTTVTLTSTSDLTNGFINPTPITANASGAFSVMDGSGMNPRFYRFSYP